MPVFEIEANGKTYEVEAPDMTTAANAFKAFSAKSPAPQTSQAPQGQPTAMPSYDAMGNPTGTTEEAPAVPDMPYGQQIGNALSGVDNGVRQVAKGIPVLGGAMENIAAAGDALTQPMFGRGSEGANFSERYAKNLTTEQQRDASFEAEHPYLSTGLNVAGGVAGLVPLANTMAGARALGMVGSLGARAAQGAAGGAAIGAADAATRGDSVALGGGLGGLLGAGSPVLGRVAGALVGRLGNKAPKDIAGYEPKAIDKIARALSDDAVDVPALQRLGPEAMLVDAGPNLRLQGEALASQPGPASRMVGNAVTRRFKSSADRITQGVDETIGPYQNFREERLHRSAMRKEAGNRLYGEAFEKSRPVDITSALQYLDDELRPGLSRVAVGGPAPDSIESALMRVRNVLGGGNTQRIDPRELHTIKLDLDDDIDAALRNGRKNKAAQLIEVRNRIVDSLDNATDEKLYAQARQQFRSDSAIINALDDGRDLFKKSTRPDDLVAAVRDMSEAEREAFKLGARDAVDEVMGTAVNDALAARNLFSKDWNQQKLQAVVGKEQADRLLHIVDREKQFAETYAAIQRGSQTRARMAAGEEFPNKVAVTNTPDVTGRTLVGTAEQATRAVANAMRSSQKSAQLDRQAQDAARILTAQGSDRDRVLQALHGLQTRQQQIAPFSKATQDLATLLAQMQREPLRQATQPKR